MRDLIVRSVLVGVIVLVHSAVWAQGINSVRGFDGGVAPLINLPGPGRLYLDSQGTQGYLYSQGAMQTYSFQTPGGPAWNGAVMTLGPNLTVGLIQGANQGSGGVVLPRAPRQTLPLPLIQSTIQSIFILQTPPLPPISPLPVPSNQSLQLLDLDQIP
jgi:hypothetical protein